MNDIHSQNPKLRLDNEPTINKQNLIDITDVPTPCLNSYPPPGLNGFKLGACLSVIKSKDIVAEVTIIIVSLPHTEDH